MRRARPLRRRWTHGFQGNIPGQLVDFVRAMPNVTGHGSVWYPAGIARCRRQNRHNGLALAGFHLSNRSYQVLRQAIPHFAAANWKISSALRPLLRWCDPPILMKPRTSGGGCVSATKAANVGDDDRSFRITLTAEKDAPAMGTIIIVADCGRLRNLPARYGRTMRRKGRALMQGGWGLSW